MSGFVDRADVELIVNGRPDGALGQQFAQVGYDAGFMRPVIMPDGQKGCMIANGRMKKNEAGDEVPEREFIPLQRLIYSGMVPAVFNVSALPYDSWFRVDRAVLRATRERLAAWNDLAAANTYGGFNGMAVTGLIKDTMTDAGDAKVDMETLSDDLNDAPFFEPDILPLPIIHAGFRIAARRLAMSRNAGMPLDTTMAEQAGRRCAETLEDMTIGMTNFSTLVTGSSHVPAFANTGIYGFRTHPDRITLTTLTAPAAGVLDAETFVQEVIAMVEAARAQQFHGPFVLYYSTTWNQYLARDYYVITTSGAAAPTMTIRQRVEQIEEISRVQMLDFFTSTDELLLVQMTSDTVRAVDGMDWTTLQYEAPLGGGVSMRVMGIKVPDIRSQFIGLSTTSSARQCGIVHGTTA